MLELLVRYAIKRGLPPPGFKPKDVRWAIICAEDGSFIGVTELGQADAKRNPGLTFSTCPDLSQPELIAEGKTRSHFLIDAAEVVALLGQKSKDAKTQAKHHFFWDLLRQAGEVMPELARAAEKLMESDVLEGIAARLEALKAKPTDKITLQIAGQFPVESEVWHDWWRTFRRGLSDQTDQAASRPCYRCFVTGELVAPCLTNPKIEGLADVGGQPSGSVLIGFDKDAFCSYGLEQAANAAVSEEAAYAYRAALNYLVKKHSQRLAGVKVAHWFKRDVEPEDDPLPWLEAPPEVEELSAQKRARELLTSIKTGQRPDLAGNEFYALTLSGSGGRVMVRDWMEGPFEELVANVAAWFDDLTITHREGGRPAPPPKFLAVLAGTVRDLDNLSAPFVAKMWQVAVRNMPIPQVALAGAVGRMRADVIQNEPAHHARMGLMKAYHLRQARMKGDAVMTEALKCFLNEDHPEPAYHCGRLMAVLAALQRRALGDVGAGVVQRYYAAASATPALVLGRLVRTSQFHLNKLEGGLANWYENKLAAIWCRIKDAPPRTLSLEEQSLFALGYYQQLADLRTKKATGEIQDKEESND